MNKPIRTSLYWDDFEQRIAETVEAVKTHTLPPVRRVAVFVTDKCNFCCQYCNSSRGTRTLCEAAFNAILALYGKTSIIHITGGEPSTVPWLYPFLHRHGNEFRFHLNTNAFILPPAASIKRLKVSLDSCNAAYWDELVGRKGAFIQVVENIKRSIQYTTVSITYTLTRENYRAAVAFAQFANQTFPGLYAVFFSVYKGSDPRFAMTREDADYFFSTVLPKLEKELPPESLALIRETIDEKRRLLQGVRFPQNSIHGMCYISLSERVIAPDGKTFTCSHLYRDGVCMTEAQRHEKCRYGCNQRLVRFCEEVEERLK